jgi:hypothetical protein
MVTSPNWDPAIQPASPHPPQLFLFAGIPA